MCGGDKTTSRSLLLPIFYVCVSDTDLDIIKYWIEVETKPKRPSTIIIIMIPVASMVASWNCWHDGVAENYQKIHTVVNNIIPSEVVFSLWSFVAGAQLDLHE